MLIDSVFNVPGVGTVAAGTVVQGVVRVGDVLLLGPDVAGQFMTVTVRSIHVQYTAVDAADSANGGTAAFAIRVKGRSDHKKGWVKKGMSLIHPSLTPRATLEFDAEIVILHHATTLVNGYSPMMHIGVVTQAVRITEMRTLTGEVLEALRTGDRAIVHCRY